MATDLETTTEGGELTPARPSLKITGLHIRGLKSIKSLDLPEDGMGWNGEIPDFVMVGGINGSGKTTLLEFLAGAFTTMDCPKPDGQVVELPPTLLASEVKVDFWFADSGLGGRTIRFLVGNKDFIQENKGGNWLGFQQFSPEMSNRFFLVGDETKDIFLFRHYVNSKNRFVNLAHAPGVVYFPTERRTLVSTSKNSNFAKRLPSDLGFVFRWEPSKVNLIDPLVERLYAIRWQDLNAMAAGSPEEATHFQSYQVAFDHFFEGRKRVKWTPRGDLVIETKSGAIHELSELSSGEKQVILFMGELLHRWRPGSLILIDEPELHLHESYQTKLWEALADWQKERGGQVILATQSGHLFRLAGSAMKVVLSRQSL